MRAILFCLLFILCLCLGCCLCLWPHLPTIVITVTRLWWLVSSTSPREVVGSLSGKGLLLGLQKTLSLLWGMGENVPQDLLLEGNLFCLYTYFVLWNTPGSTYGLLLVLSSRITSGRLRGSPTFPRITMGVPHARQVGTLPAILFPGPNTLIQFKRAPPSS